MKFEFSTTISIDISEPKLDRIVYCFASSFSQIFKELSQQVLIGFANEYMSWRVKPFSCATCGNDQFFKWKTHRGKSTSLLTIFGQLILSQLQIQCTECGHKFYLTRKLLGVAPRKRIPLSTIRCLGLIGALTSFRVAKKIVGMFGIHLDKMSIWRSVQKLSHEIELGLDPTERSIGEADGTGIPIQGIGKGHRGKELKVFIQLKKGGGVRVAGLSIGSYDGNWDKLFKPLIGTLKGFKKFLLITDGDTNILKGLKGKVDILFQRCLWHIPHQFKWHLWKDGIKKKSPLWSPLLSQLLNIVTVKNLLDPEAKECIEDIVEKKRTQLNELIEDCKRNALITSAVYLENAAPDMFTSVAKKLGGLTTSHAERVMRTVNMRINVGKWSPQGALNAMKIRLAYYYNGFDIENATRKEKMR